MVERIPDSNVGGYSRKIRKGYESNINFKIDDSTPNVQYNPGSHNFSLDDKDDKDPDYAPTPKNYHGGDPPSAGMPKLKKSKDSLESDLNTF